MVGALPPAARDEVSSILQTRERSGRKESEDLCHEHTSPMMPPFANRRWNWPRPAGNPIATLLVIWVSVSTPCVPGGTSMHPSRILLLSATPHQGDDERFLYLLHLARPDLFQPGNRPLGQQLTTAALTETLTRTPKSRAVDWNGIPLFKGHATTTLDVRWTVEETEISRLLTEYILKSLDFVRDSDRGTQLVVQLVMHTFHKLAASSWPALERALQRRLGSLQGRVERLIDLLEADEEEGSDEVRDFALPTKTFFDNERVLLETLLKRLRELSQDSKWNH